MKYLLTLFLGLIYNISHACSCENIDSSNVKLWIEIADIVIEGKYVSNVHLDEVAKLERNIKRGGSNILFEVTKVIRGEVARDTVVINQWSNGNCTQMFKKGQKYIIFGRQINGFQSKMEEYNAKYKSFTGDDKPQIPPLDSISRQNIWTTFSYNKETVEYWNGLLNKYKVYHTSYCSSFQANSSIKRIIRN